MSYTEGTDTWDLTVTRIWGTGKGLLHKHGTKVFNAQRADPKPRKELVQRLWEDTGRSMVSFKEIEKYYTCSQKCQPQVQPAFVRSIHEKQPCSQCPSVGPKTKCDVAMRRNTTQPWKGMERQSHWRISGTLFSNELHLEERTCYMLPLTGRLREGSQNGGGHVNSIHADAIGEACTDNCDFLWNGLE